jgi:DNA invertase Pin-like site-specific DNA recombinase
MKGSESMDVVGYLRVSTREQADSGLGLDAQRRAITDEADRRGWSVTWCVDDGYTARNVNRPALQEALRLLKRQEAEALVVYKLDRLSRSMRDFSVMLDGAIRQSWAVVAFDVGLDMTTPNGELVANIIGSVARWESRIIGARTKDAIAEVRARGGSWGRERQAPVSTVRRIMRARHAGKTYAAIAADLDAASIPTPGGGQRWYPSTVQRLVRAEAEAACESPDHRCVILPKQP